MRTVTCLALLVAVLVVLPCAAGDETHQVAVDGEVDFDTRESTEPLAELLRGRWRVDVVVDDLSSVLTAARERTRDEDDTAAPEGGMFEQLRTALNSAFGTSQRALRSMVRSIYPDEPGFYLELTGALHDGVLVGAARVHGAGHDWLRDALLAGARSTAAPPALALGGFDGSRNVVETEVAGALAAVSAMVECSTMTACRLTLGDIDAPLGVIHLSLAYRSPGAKQRLRAGKFEWRPSSPTPSLSYGGVANESASGAASASTGTVELAGVRGALLISSNKHGFATVVSRDPTVPAASQSTAPPQRQHRFMLRRETPDISASPKSTGMMSWVGTSWWSTAVYAVLLLLVLGGKFGVQIYYKQVHGIDLGPWIKSLYGRGPKTAPRRRLPPDEELHRRMAQDDAIERVRRLRTGKD